MTIVESSPSADYLKVERARVTRPVTMRTFHAHNPREIYWLMDGERYYFIQDRVFRIVKGDIVLIDSGTVHRTVNAGTGGPCERLLVTFSDDLLKGTCLSSNVNPTEVFRPGFRIVRPEPVIRARIEQLLLHLLEEQTLRRAGYETISVAILVALLLLLQRSVPDGARVGEEQSSPLHERISHITRYLDQYHDSDVTLDHLAERFCVSKFHMCRTFREVTGSTVLGYLNSVRVAEAKRLLCDTGQPVAFVAGATGFGSTAHLDRVFRRSTGMTPVEYRNHISTGHRR